jgi:hypothetical protein
MTRRRGVDVRHAISIDPAIPGGDYSGEYVWFGDVCYTADLFTIGRIMWLMTIA